MRIAASIEYDGQFFCGWQRQNDVPNIQILVEQALSSISQSKITISRKPRCRLLLRAVAVEKLFTFKRHHRAQLAKHLMRTLPVARRVFEIGMQSPFIAELGHKKTRISSGKATWRIFNWRYHVGQKHLSTILKHSFNSIVCY